MVLTCTYSWSVSDDWVSFRRSSIVWMHSYEDNQGVHKRTLETNYNYLIETEKRREELVSRLTIYELGQFTYGRYTCKNKKTDMMATVDLQTLPGEITDILLHHWWLDQCVDTCLAYCVILLPFKRDLQLTW